MRGDLLVALTNYCDWLLLMKENGFLMEKMKDSGKSGK